MSNEIDEENDNIDLSARSQDIENDRSTLNEYIRPSSSRLSSASRRKQNQHEEEPSANENDQTPRKSPVVEDNDENHFSNDQDYVDEQPTIHDRLHPSIDINELSNDGPHIDDLPLTQRSDDHHQIIPDHEYRN